MTRAGTFASGAPGAVALAGGLALAAALFLAPGAAWAQGTNAPCGTLDSNGAATCSGATYATGIAYWDQASGVALTVPGTATTATVTAANNGYNGLNIGIVIRASAHASEARNIALTVGGTGTSVAIVQGSSPMANAWYRNHGIFVSPVNGNGSTITVDVKSGVTIGAANNKMRNTGISVRATSSNFADGGAISVTSAAAIHSVEDGISVENFGTGAVTVANSGAIVTDSRGIYVFDRGTAGAVTVTSSGAITSADTTNGEGIFAKTTNKDTAGTNAGVSITHSAGAISVSAGGVGIKAHVGAARQEDDVDHASYVAPMNTGLARVAVTGGSVTSRGSAIQATNFEAGSVEVTTSAGVTLTSSRGHGIDATLTDVGNTAGTISVTNAATIAAGTTAMATGHGIFVKRAAGTGAVSVTNRGAITASGSGISAAAQDAAITVTNHGAIGTADDPVARGISAAARNAAVTVTNSGAVTASGDGIHAAATGTTASAAVTVTHSAAAISSSSGMGIRAYVGESRGVEAEGVDAMSGPRATYVAPMHTGLAKVAVTGGSVRARTAAIQAFNYEAGSVEVAVSAGVTLTSTHGRGIHAELTDVGNTEGTVTIVQAGTVDAARNGIIAIRSGGSGAVSVTNSGAVRTGAWGIFALARGGGGTVTVTNSGAIGTADAPALRGIFAAHDGAGTTGGVTVTNSADITATDHGIVASLRGQDAAGANLGVTVTHSAGAIVVASDESTDDGVQGVKEGVVVRVGGFRADTDPDDPRYVAPVNTGLARAAITGGSVHAKGVAVEVANYEAGSVEIAIAAGVTLTSTHDHAIDADLRDVGNRSGTITITQAGTLAAETDGISARAAWIGGAGPTRAIDITWTGTFTSLEYERTPIANLTRALQAARRLAREGLEIHWTQGSAGIDAGVMGWPVFQDVVTRSDDPGAFADAAAVTALFADDADAATKARAAAIVEQLKAVLTDDKYESLGTIPGVLTDDADGNRVDADSDGTVTDMEIEDYLSVDDPARRTLLRNVLALSYTPQELAVFEAVMTGGDVDAALDDADFSDDYKDAVKAMLNRHNTGDIRIAMNAGSIDSRSNGIRAWYAMPHDDNGSIEITVAEGATVKGGVAGIYVANAGTGLRVERKYTSPAIQDENEALGADDLVSLPDYLNQVVRVQGTVTGGSDAAVHLAGGGALIVTGAGKLVAGPSGHAVLVNDPGPAVIYIDGEVRGGKAASGDERAVAAVETTGGTVILGRTGSVVLAEGATDAIRSDGAPTAVIVQTVDLTRESAEEALERLEGAIVGDIAGDAVTLAEVQDDGTTTGHVRENLPLENGRVPERVIADLPSRAFRCDDAMDGRCRLYEALPSILLAMNDLPTYAERTSAARDAHGAWARVEMARGEWQADKATTTPGKLAYDHRRTGGRAGVDFIAGERGRVGVSVHVLRGKAEMSGGGEAELDGKGAGLSATWLVGDLYVDVQAGAMWYDAELDSAAGRRLVDEVDGRGHALGLDVGKWMALGDGVVVTPRAGLAWSKVDLDDFTDSVGSGAKVSVRDARSTKGRVGVMVETAVGSEDAPGRVFGSVDVEHEFQDETSVDVSGNHLETTVKPTGVRLGLGGEFSLGEGVVLRARADYTTSGGDTSEYGGGVELNLRF